MVFHLEVKKFFVEFRAIKTKTWTPNQFASENFARKTLFFKNKTQNKNGNNDVPKFFWYPMHESIVTQFFFKLSWKKQWEGTSHSLPVKYKTIDWDWRLVHPKLEKKNSHLSKTRQKIKQDAFWLGGQIRFLYSFEQSKLTLRLWNFLLRENFARKTLFFKDETHNKNDKYDVLQFF